MSKEVYDFIDMLIDVERFNEKDFEIIKMRGYLTDTEAKNLKDKKSSKEAEKAAKEAAKEAEKAAKEAEKAAKEDAKASK